MILLLTTIVFLAGLPFLIKAIRHQHRNRLLLNQLRQSIQGMAHSLQVGSSFLQALERAARDGDDPLAREWRTLLHSVRMGVPVQQSLTELGERVPLKE